MLTQSQQVSPFGSLPFQRIQRCCTVYSSFSTPIANRIVNSAWHSCATQHLMKHPVMA